MNLNEITVSALTQLGRSSDAANVSECRIRFSLYANQAQQELADAIGFYRTHTVPADGGVITLSRLPRVCVKVLRVVQQGHCVPFGSGDNSDRILLPYNSPALITYRCQPKKLMRSSDECELDQGVQGLIVTYVVGRERLVGDVNSQRGGNIYLSMFENAKSQLRIQRGAEDSYRIINKF